MADLQKLIDWYLEKAELLDLRATHFTWTDLCCKGWDDVQVSISSNAGKRFVGRGFVGDQNLAFVKAGSEAIERLACAHSGISSLGVAVHQTKELAQENAKLELFERQQAEGSACDSIFGVGSSAVMIEAAEKAAVELFSNLALLHDPQTADSGKESAKLVLKEKFNSTLKKASLLKLGNSSKFTFETIDLESALETSCIFKAERCRFD